MQHNPVLTVMLTQCWPVGVLEGNGWVSLLPLLWEFLALSRTPMPASVQTCCWTAATEEALMAQCKLSASSKVLELRQLFIPTWHEDGVGCWLSRAAPARNPVPISSIFLVLVTKELQRDW